MRTRKPVEAWAVVRKDGVAVTSGSVFDHKGEAENYAARWKGRCVHLTESNPSASAELKALRRVVRAAVKYARPENDAKAFQNYKVLFRVVQSYLSKRKGRK